MGNPSNPDPKKAIVFFRNFLEENLEDVISQTMLTLVGEPEPDPRVIMIQAPRFCPSDYTNHTAYTRGIVTIGRKHYPIEVVADFPGGMIYIRSEVFGVDVRYDFVNGKLLGFESRPPYPVIAKDYCPKGIEW